MSASGPISRKWLKTKLETSELSKSLKNKWLYLNTVEGNIYKQWHKNCLEQMMRIKLHICIEDLFNYVASPEVSVTKALAKAQKQYAKESNKVKQKAIGKMISYLQRLANSEKTFYHEALNALNSQNKTTNILEDIAKRIETSDEILSEYSLFTGQCIKHYNRLLKLGVTPSVHELYQALDARFAGNTDMFNKQVVIVCSTHVDGQDVPDDIKDVCFDFIKESIAYAGYLHASLIEYIFKNDRLSERAYQLFVDAEQGIREKGMHSLPKTYANRIAKKKGLYDKPVAELSDSDVRILRIEKMFS